MMALLIAKPAYAYIGPAIAAIGYLLGPVVAIIAAAAMILIWPVYRLFKRHKSKNQPEDKKDEDSGT